MASEQLKNIGLALGGLSAGIGGQLPQFQQVQQNQQLMDYRMQQDQQQQAAAEEEKRRMMEIERQKTMFTDANAALQLLEKDNYDGVIRLGINRLQLLQQFPGANPEDTQRLTQLAIAARNGEEEAKQLLRDELEGTVEMGRALGVLESPKSAEGATDLGKLQQDLNAGLITQEQYGQAAAKATAEKPQEGYELIPAEEAVGMGLAPDKAYQRNTATGQISQIGGGGVEVNVGQATEGERNAGSLAGRLDFAQSQINDVLAQNPDAEEPGVLPTLLSKAGFDYLANATNDADRQIIEAAQDDMLDAALTISTGAAYTKQQFDSYKRSLFPQLNDDNKTREAKLLRLTNFIEQAYKKAGRAAPETMRSAESSAQAGGEGLSEAERAELQELRARYGR